MTSVAFYAQWNLVSHVKFLLWIEACEKRAGGGGETCIWDGGRNCKLKEFALTKLFKIYDFYQILLLANQIKICNWLGV
jgi:hypothetical protein